MSDRHTLPLGVFTPPGGGHPRIGLRVDGDVVDLAALAALADSPFSDLLAGESLDAVLGSGPEVWELLREQLLDWVWSGAITRWCIPLADVRLVMPFTVADYVDFYASEQHAAAVGAMFRPGQPPLPRAWPHLPQGYHGRAGTVVVSGTSIARPSGLMWDNDNPIHQPTARLDVEVEVGFVVGAPSALGKPLCPNDFRRHVFGLVIVNDWSARDIQAFETVPLGPHTGKSFATSISPWVVPLAALDHLLVSSPSATRPGASYLMESMPAGLDLDLELSINGEIVAWQPFSSQHWSPAQMLAQLTVTGASVRTGDLFASGTVSGPLPEQAGSLLELWQQERFLADGDEVVISGSARGPIAGSGDRLDLGWVSGRIASASSTPPWRPSHSTQTR